jgi:hypothetical protein
VGYANRKSAGIGSVLCAPGSRRIYVLNQVRKPNITGPDLLKDMQEVRRVLKPGGTFVVIAESYENGANERLQRPVMKLLGSTNLGIDDQRTLFSTAGYTDVQIFEERSQGWICATGKKP